MTSLDAPLPIPDALEVLVGRGPLSRVEVVNRLFAYVDRHALRAGNTTIDLALDAKLGAMLPGRERVLFTELAQRANELITQHQEPAEADDGWSIEDFPEDCPICRSSDDCDHLVARLDMFFGGVEAGTFRAVEKQAMKALNEGVIAWLREMRRRRRNKLAPLPAIDSFSLDMLVGQAQSRINSLATGSLSDCGRHLLNYLDDIFLELGDRERTTWESASAPGMSTEYWCFWSKEAKVAANEALALILSDAQALTEIVAAAK